MLVDSELDSLRVWNSIVALNFIHLNPGKVLPSSVWINIAGQILLGEEKPKPESSDKDFMSQQAYTIGEIYKLIGQRISAVKIENNGQMKLYIGDKMILIGTQPSVSEKIWSVMNDDYDVDKTYDWHVEFNESEGLFVKSPVNEQEF